MNAWIFQYTPVITETLVHTRRPYTSTYIQLKVGLL